MNDSSRKLTSDMVILYLYIAMVLVSSTGVTMDMKLEYIKMMPHNIN